MLYIRHAFLLSVSFSILIGFSALGEEKHKDTLAEKEAKQAAAEDAADAKKSELEQTQLIKNFTGKFSLSQPDGKDANPEVIGVLQIPDGTVYQIKPDPARGGDPADATKSLAAYDNKQVTLKGKLRNDNKYLIFMQVVLPAGGGAAEIGYRGKL